MMTYTGWWINCLNIYLHPAPFHNLDWEGVFVLQMSPQNTSPKRGKVTLAALFTFPFCAFSNASSYCQPQKRHSHIGCTCWLFSTVRFQMPPQMACLRRGIITLVALIWLFSTVHFQMCPQIAWIRWCIVTLVAFVWFFPLCVFKCVLKLLTWESHWLHWFGFSPLCVFKWPFKALA